MTEKIITALLERNDVWLACTLGLLAFFGWLGRLVNDYLQDHRKMQEQHIKDTRKATEEQRQLIMQAARRTLGGENENANPKLPKDQ